MADSLLRVVEGCTAVSAWAGGVSAASQPVHPHSLSHPVPLPSFTAGKHQATCTSPGHMHQLPSPHALTLTPPPGLSIPLLETCRYYTQEVHRAAFVLPAFAKEALAGSLTY